MFNIFRRKQAEEKFAFVTESTRRVAIFMDGQNCFRSAEEAYRNRPYMKAMEVAIRKSLSDNETIFKKFFYQHPDDITAAFEGSLLRNDWIVRKTRGDGDAEIIQDIWESSELVDKVILATGDGHFVRTMQHLKSLGKQVAVMAVPSRSCNPILRNSADIFIPITQEMIMFNKIEGQFQRERKELGVLVG